jgi:hypothetical protein
MHVSTAQMTSCRSAVGGFVLSQVLLRYAQGVPLAAQGASCGSEWSNWKMQQILVGSAMLCSSSWTALSVSPYLQNLQSGCFGI